MVEERTNPRADAAPVQRAAVEAVWRAHRRWLAAVVYAHLPRGTDLDDVLQETAMRLVTNFHHLTDPSAIRPWLRTVAINVARSAGRKRRVRERERHGFAAGHFDELASLAVEQAPAPAPTQRGERALAIAQSLPPHYREPLLLSLRGLSQRQIAESLEIPLTTVETRLIRARRMIREELRQDDRRLESMSPALTAPLTGEGEFAP